MSSYIPTEIEELRIERNELRDKAAQLARKWRNEASSHKSDAKLTPSMRDKLKCAIYESCLTECAAELEAAFGLTKEKP